MSENHKDAWTFSTVLKHELKLLRQKEVALTENPDGPEPPNHQYDNAHEANLTGLAFSGGGIRSATFNLGVIQALGKSVNVTKDWSQPQKNDEASTRPGLLPLFDYLSTVSGGGYIGCWLSAFLHRENKDRHDEESEDLFELETRNVRNLQTRISTKPCSIGEALDDESECFASSGFKTPRSSGFPPLEHAAIRHLRRFSNYLTPRLGISGDLLAVISLFLRNFVILQMALISLVAAVLLIPYCISSISVFMIRSSAGPIPWNLLFTLGGVVLLIGTMVIWRRQFHDLPMPESNGDESQQQLQELKQWRRKLRRRQRTSGWWMALSVVLLPLAFWMIIISSIPFFAGLHRNLEEVPLLFALFYAAAYYFAWIISPGSVVSESEVPKQLSRKAERRDIVALLVSLLFGLLVHFCTVIFDAATFYAPGRMALVSVIGAPVVLLITSFVIAVQLGLSRNLFEEKERERWARAGGLVLLAAVLWFFIFSVSVYAPPLLNWLGNGGFAILIGWATASGVGAWMARQATAVDGNALMPWKGLLLKAVPWVFLIGLALIVSYGLSAVVQSVSLGKPLGSPDFPSELPLQTGVAVHSMLVEFVSVSKAFFLLVLTLIIFLIISWRLDLNIFSAHTMYRNRLVRAYLGASNLKQRNPHPFTGFDPKDDMKLTVLSKQRPLPIINATINMTGGDDLAWQTRRAASFTFTPKFVGYETKSSKGIDLGGFRKTADFASCETFFEQKSTDARDADKDSITLGTALAISGAAASPNMGYNTSTPISALLTVFNLRLAYWAGNPSGNLNHKTGNHDQKKEGKTRDRSRFQIIPSWRRKRPLISAWPLISELMGSADAESRWINLSDGGHFDNLGIYELVRRRCRFMVVTDAGCDPKHQFQDLANSVRKCWTDFGVHIFFPDLENISFTHEDEHTCQQHGSLGLIEYPDRGRPEETEKKRDEQRYGLILYLKCSLTRNEMEKYIDIRQYAETHNSFPHEPTSDQFFDENQFEAYRHLGYCVAEQYRSMIEGLFEKETGLIDPSQVLKEARRINRIQKKSSETRNWGISR